MLILEVLDEFLRDRYNKGLLPRSIQDYEAFIQMFVKYSGNIEISMLTSHLISDYIRGLYLKGLSKATIGTYLRNLKIFLKFCETNSYITTSLSTRVTIPKQPKKILTIYSDDEIKLIFSKIDIKIEWLRYRNSAIVALLLDCGLRLSEVVNLKRGDINYKDRVIKVSGKGDKERLVPMGKMTEFYIENYIALAKEENCMETDGALFITNKREPITRDTIKQLIQKMTYKLPFEFSAHKLRHNFATNYCIDEYLSKGSMDAIKLKILMGHEDLETTMRYIHLANQIIISKTDISHLDKIYS